MPLLKFHIRKGRSPEEIERRRDAEHHAMVCSFAVPERDRYRIVHEHDVSPMRSLDTGLDIPRTDRFVFVELVSRLRPRECSVPASGGSDLG